MRIEPFSLHGTYVSLAPLALDLAPALLVAANADRSTFGYTAVPADASSMHQYIETLLADAQCDAAVPFVQVRRSDGAPIGCTRFMNVTWWIGRSTPIEVEIGGTWLARDAQRTPMNREAKLLLMTHAFEQWGVARVAICTDARNQQSRTAIEQLGATFEGVLRNHRPSAGHLTASGTSRDTAVYSVLDREWPDVRARLMSSGQR